ncbi:hypothetical protein Fmac_021227 [Flemingia macrophylla]|uniref:non-specific serine/threonine protein kinase n=1 Tax=Flemingia macrophylla TaxID=520843 RepID=A0ABD1LXZ0_9FABA
MSRISTSLDTLAVDQSLHDGETLVSEGGIIAVGFFSPGNSTRRYLGVWFTNVSPITVVWVANRNKPLENTKGVLKLNGKGTLELLNDRNITIWSSNISTKAVNNPVAHPLDSGNFVVRNEEETKGSVLWQSFDYPGDTLVPGMKIGWNLETGLERYLSSWRSDDDPAEGEYAQKLDLRGYPQSIKFKGHDIKSRSGSWNGLALVGRPAPVPETLQKFVMNEKEVYYEFDILVSALFSVYKLIPSGTGESWYWTTQMRTLQVATTGEVDQCENYAFCGANSICSSDGNWATCECLRGYVPKSTDQWNMAVWVDGCIPRNKSSCENSNTDGFLRYTHLKLPDTSSSWFNTTMNLDECRKSCLKNCTCAAYANLDIRDGGTGCLLWFNTLTDTRKFSEWGQDLYIRVPASELDDVGHGNLKKKTVEIAVGVIIFGLVTCACIFITKNPVLANATEDFSTKNKLGEGGFGPVYKGKLPDGQELAVKRLSKKSGQGLEEFKNEVALIAKLQHHQTKKKLIDWCKRFNVIIGIARGLLYLHQDSSGYMSPEYVARGHFSVKSDVFSYGVIILEILSGKKNREFSNPKHYNNLLGHAWTLWTEDRALELLDEVLGEQFMPTEVIRCIHVGLLCVQQRPEDRPNMLLVVLMLNGDKLLPKPKVPGFYTEIDVTSEANSSPTNQNLGSINELSITVLDAR